MRNGRVHRATYEKWQVHRANYENGQVHRAYLSVDTLTSSCLSDLTRGFSFLEYLHWYLLCRGSGKLFVSASDSPSDD